MMSRLRIVIPIIGALLLLATAINSGRTTTSTLPSNTWVNLQAGGVAAGAGVGDEGFSTFVFSPGLRKAVVFGKYHARELAWGEDQNALLAYDFASNRWDLLEVTEAAWSEFLPGVGHDQGWVALDPRRDLYITRGNMTLFGNTQYQTYIFDLRAGRGKRMLPSREPPPVPAVAAAFDPDRGFMLAVGPGAWIYDPDKNLWTELEGAPPARRAPGLVYDRKYRIFVMFGGNQSNETWIFDPTARRWHRRTPAPVPPPRNAPNMAFDAANGVTLLAGGMGPGERPLNDAWVYDAGRDTWTQLDAPAPPNTSSFSGNNLAYDSHHRVFLLKDVSQIRNVWAFRYVPPR
jgi:hypothetical protein